MSSWQYDPMTHTIRNLDHGTWEFKLSEVRSREDLLYWLLQAGQKGFNMQELFEAFREAIDWCFGKQEVNGAAALKELFDVFPTGAGPVDFVNGKVGGP